MQKLNASAYVNDGRLFIVGVADTAHGVLPFTYHVKVKGDVPNGPVVIGAEDNHPAVEHALSKASGPIAFNIQKEAIKLVAESLVERSRQGDQNATAILCLVRENAQAGKPKAVFALKVLKDYIKKNPVSEDSFGAEALVKKKTALVPLKKALAAPNATGSRYAAIVSAYVPSVGSSIQSVMNAATAIANEGQPIDNKLLSEVQGTVPAAHKKIFADGVKYSGDANRIKSISAKLKPEARKSLQIGYAMGMAKSIQDVRKPDAKIETFSKTVAWELGEPVRLPKAESMSKAMYNSTLPSMPDSIKAKNISKAGVVPPGYKLYQGNAPVNVQNKAKDLVYSSKDFGYEQYVNIDGVDYFFRIEPHYHPPGYTGYKGAPTGWHKGVTTYIKVQPPQEKLSLIDVPDTDNEFVKNLVG